LAFNVVGCGRAFRGRGPIGERRFDPKRARVLWWRPAGFGGCAVSVVRTEAVPRITHQMDEAYERKTGIQATIFSSRPAAGARVLK